MPLKTIRRGFPLPKQRRDGRDVCEFVVDFKVREGLEALVAASGISPEPLKHYATGDGSRQVLVEIVQ